MTIAYWCVLVAAYLPLLWTGVAKFSGGGFPPEKNRNPREFMETLGGFRKRAYWAQMNGFEAFPPFAAAVIIAHLTQAPQASIDGLAIAFIVLRLLYGMFYLTDKAGLRSTVWFGAVACVFALFIISA